MSQKAILQEGIEKLRNQFQPEDADIQLSGWENGIAEVTLVFGPNVCKECIAPKEAIKMMVEETVAEKITDLKDVVIVDPREEL